VCHRRGDAGGVESAGGQDVLAAALVQEAPGQAQGSDRGGDAAVLQRHRQVGSDAAGSPVVLGRDHQPVVPRQPDEAGCDRTHPAGIDNRDADAAALQRGGRVDRVRS